jgi:hypothetical protein
MAPFNTTRAVPCYDPVLRDATPCPATGVVMYAMSFDAIVSARSVSEGGRRGEEGVLLARWHPNGEKVHNSRERTFLTADHACALASSVIAAWAGLVEGRRAKMCWSLVNDGNA